jgi:hypothetical protein
MSYLEGFCIMNVFSQLTTYGSKVETSFPSLNQRPLFFVHIPKTAGASLQQLLDTMFDDEDVFPGWNPPDIASFELDTKKYKLFRGHFTAGQRCYASSDAELFTVLRQPEHLLQSFYRWMRTIDTNSYYEDAQCAASYRDVILKYDKSKQLSDLAIASAKNQSFEQFLHEAGDAGRMMKDNIQMRYLSDVGNKGEEDRIFERFIDNNDNGECKNYLVRSTNANYEQCIAVGLFELLEHSIHILCWKRVWPAANGLPHIHLNLTQGGVKAKYEIAESTRSLISKWIELDVILYERASVRFEQEWNTLVREVDKSGHKSISEFLNARHRSHFFSVQPPIAAFDLSATRAWPGTGWGIRERNEHGQVWRWIGSIGKATLLLKLIPDKSYLIGVVIYTAADMEVLNSIEVSVLGKPLHCVNTEQIDGSPSFTWVIDKEIVTHLSGEIEAEVSINAQGKEKVLALSRVACLPLKKGF